MSGEGEKDLLDICDALRDLPHQYLKTIVRYRDKRFLVSSVNLRSWFSKENVSETMAFGIGSDEQSEQLIGKADCPENHFRLVSHILKHGNLELNEAGAIESGVEYSVDTEQYVSHMNALMDFIESKEGAD